MTSPFLRHPTSWHHAAAQSLCVCALNDFQLFFQKWLARSSSHPEAAFRTPTMLPIIVIFDVGSSHTYCHASASMAAAAHYNNG